MTNYDVYLKMCDDYVTKLCVEKVDELYLKYVNNETTRSIEFEFGYYLGLCNGHVTYLAKTYEIETLVYLDFCNNVLQKIVNNMSVISLERYLHG